MNSNSVKTELVQDQIKPLSSDKSTYMNTKA